MTETLSIAYTPVEYEGHYPPYLNIKIEGETARIAVRGPVVDGQCGPQASIAVPLSELSALRITLPDAVATNSPGTHPFEPHPKWPWFCKNCGYAAHERLKHDSTTAPAATTPPASAVERENGPTEQMIEAAARAMAKEESHSCKTLDAALLHQETTDEQGEG